MNCWADDFVKTDCCILLHESIKTKCWTEAVNKFAWIFTYTPIVAAMPPRLCTHPKEMPWLVAKHLTVALSTTRSVWRSTASCAHRQVQIKNKLGRLDLDLNNCFCVFRTWGYINVNCFVNAAGVDMISFHREESTTSIMSYDPWLLSRAHVVFTRLTW